MKRTALLLLCVALAFALAACTGTNPAADPSDGPGTSDSTESGESRTPVVVEQRIAKIGENGRFLIEDWLNRRGILLLPKIDLATWKDDRVIIREKGFEIKLPRIGNGPSPTESVPIPLMQITVGERVFVLPQNINGALADFILSQDGSTLFLATTLGLWSVDAATGNVTEITAADDARVQTIKEYTAAHDSVVPYSWAGYLYPHPTRNRIAYTSARDVWPETGNRIYVHELGSGSVTVLGRTDVRNCIEGWIGDDALLCSFTDEAAQKTFGIVSLDGTILPLDGEAVPLAITGENPTVYGVADGLFLYGETIGSNRMHLIRRNDNGDLTEWSEEIGEACGLIGPKSFSPSAAKCAISSNPHKMEMTFELTVWSWKTADFQTIRAEELTGNPEDYVADFFWIDDETLCVKTTVKNEQKPNDPNETYAFWVYALKK